MLFNAFLTLVICSLGLECPYTTSPSPSYLPHICIIVVPKTLIQFQKQSLGTISSKKTSMPTQLHGIRMNL